MNIAIYVLRQLSQMPYPHLLYKIGLNSESSQLPSSGLLYTLVIYIVVKIFIYSPIRNALNTQNTSLLLSMHIYLGLLYKSCNYELKYKLSKAYIYHSFL